MKSGLEQALEFVFECEKLKGVLRQSRPNGLDRAENAAEHSWSVIVMAMSLLPELAPELEEVRVLRMLALHDVVEIDAGDTFLYGDTSGQAGAEKQAAERIFGLLPEARAREFRAVWEEFEAMESAEAKFARAIDRAAPILQNFRNEGASWRANGVRADQVLAKSRFIADCCPPLWEEVRSRVEEARERGWLG
ncbi:MAG: HD domain-containing protein [Verrucomicrobiales bacterium]